MCKHKMDHFGSIGRANYPTVQEITRSTAVLANAASQLLFYLPYNWRFQSENIRLSWNLGAVIPSAVTITQSVQLYDGFDNILAPERTVPVGDTQAKPLSAFSCNDQTKDPASCILWSAPRDPNHSDRTLCVGRAPYEVFVINVVNSDLAAAVTDFTATIRVMDCECDAGVPCGDCLGGDGGDETRTLRSVSASRIMAQGMAGTRCG